MNDVYTKNSSDVDFMSHCLSGRVECVLQCLVKG